MSPFGTQEKCWRRLRYILLIVSIALLTPSKLGALVPEPDPSLGAPESPVHFSEPAVKDENPASPKVEEPYCPLSEVRLFGTRGFGGVSAGSGILASSGKAQTMLDFLNTGSYSAQANSVWLTLNSSRNFLGNLTTSSACLARKVTKALESCSTLQGMQEVLKRTPRAFGAGSADSFSNYIFNIDDCVAFAILKDNYQGNFIDFFRSQNIHACWPQSECYQFSRFFDQSCNIVESSDPRIALQQTCNELKLLLSFDAITVSPISLLIDGADKLSPDYTFVRFPLDPYQSNRSYIWRTSDHSPLLVFDPQHRGNITSGTQLFGNWTFGGKTQAKLEGSNAQALRPTPWESGYEALQTLDHNQDGVLRGEELRDLGLWYDKDQDGLSAPGEVRSLSKEGVTAIYTRPDYQEPITKDIYAKLGFERNIEGRVSYGASVDWFTEQEESASRLVAKLALLATPTESLKDSSHVALLESTPRESNVADSVAKNLRVLSQKFEGVWLWTLDGATSPTGFLTFHSTKEGSVKGRGYLEIPFRKRSSEGTRGILTINAFHGAATLNGKSKIELHISGKSSADSSSDSVIVLEKDGNSLSGKTTQIFSASETQAKYRYRWHAVRLK